MKNSILVTGGAGFVGSALLREFQSQCPSDAQVTVVDDFSFGREEFLPTDSRITVSKLDIRDRKSVFACIEQIKPDVVYHLAAMHFIPACNKDPDKCLEVNVIGTQNILDALRLHPPKTVVAISSAAVYPIFDSKCSEDKLDPGPTDIYGLSKLTNEMQLRQFAAETTSTCSAVRLFNVIGPRETNPHVLPAIIEQLLRGDSVLNLGNVEPKRDYIDSRDVASAFVSIANRTADGFRTYNVGSGHEYSVRELVAMLSEIVGRPLTIESDPSRVRASDRMHLLSDISRIHDETGWSPAYGIRESLENLWHWYNARGKAIG
jgi:UDP-glucose 4-epimerase